MPLPQSIQTFIDRQADGAPERYDDLRAVIFNGTLKRSPEPSNTDGMLAIVRGILRRVEVTVDEIRTIDHDIPAGMETDLREHGCDRDEFPAIYRELVTPADIILICGPIWLGDQSSQTRKIIERLYAYSSEVNQAGQWAYYGQGGRCAYYRQRRRRQTRQRPGSLRVAAHWPRDPSPIRHVLDGGSRSGPLLPRSRRRRGAQRMGHAQHRVHDLERAPSRSHAQGRWRDSCLRQLNPRLGPHPADEPKPQTSVGEAGDHGRTGARHPLYVPTAPSRVRSCFAYANRRVETSAHALGCRENCGRAEVLRTIALVRQPAPVRTSASATTEQLAAPRNRVASHKCFHAGADSARMSASATFRSRETNLRTWPAGPWPRGAVEATLHTQPSVLARRGAGPAFGDLRRGRAVARSSRGLIARAACWCTQRPLGWVLVTASCGGRRWPGSWVVVGRGRCR